MDRDLAALVIVNQVISFFPVLRILEVGGQSLGVVQVIIFVI
jgi:hypothetical protein